MEEQPQESEKQQESAEQRQKRYELLYAYARMSYDEEKKRLDEAEAKAARLFPLIVLLLGVGSVGIKEAATTVEQFTNRSLIFLIPYACFYLTSIGSIFAFLRAIAIRSVKSPSIERNVIEYFDRNTYLTIIYSYSRDFLSYVREISGTVDRKYTALKWAYRLLVASVILAFMSTIGYVSLSSERIAMSKEKPDQQSQP
jgi:hypothetical protein